MTVEQELVELQQAHRELLDVNAGLRRVVSALMDASEARQAGHAQGTSFRLFGQSLTLQHLVDSKTQALTRALDELGQTQAMLLHAQKLEAVGQLAAGVAHEINTPMQYVGDNLRFLQKAFSKVLGMAAALEEMAEDPRIDPATRGAVQAHLSAAKLAFIRKRAPRSFEQAIEGVGVVTRIVSAMKAFSHPGTEERVPTQVNALVETTQTICRNEWKYVADLELSLAADLPDVLTHPSEINQVLLNLIVNAAHAIGESRDVAAEGKGTIDVSTRRTPHGVTVRVADNGSGMPDHVLARIFEPFFTTKEVGKGTGQGLAICHQIVTQHGGTIHVESEPGEGTAFELCLPLSEAEEQVA